MNEFEEKARAEKALKLARAIYAEMLRVVGNLADHEWESFAAGIGVKTPSEATKAAVLEILKGKDPTRADLPQG